jgi:hypothetical protein
MHVAERDGQSIDSAPMSSHLQAAVRSQGQACLDHLLAAVLGLAPPQLRELSFVCGFGYELTRDRDGWAMVATCEGSKADRFHMLTDLPRPEELLRLRRAARGLLERSARVEKP